MNFTALNDAENAETAWLQIIRGTGTNINSVSFPNGKFGIGTFAPQYSLHVVGQDVRVESNTTTNFPRFSWNFTGGGSHEKKWQVYAAPLTLNFSALDDFESFENIWLQVTRSNLTNISSVAFPSYYTLVGIGTATPQAKLHISHQLANFFHPIALRVESDLSGGTIASFGDKGEFQIDSPGIAGGRFLVRENGTVVLGDCPGCFPVSDRLVVSGTIRVTNLGSSGSSSLCRNSSNQISACSSSRRYKTNIADFSSGLNLLNRLRPVTFDWKESKEHDFGLVAEEVAEVEPLLVTHNDKGEIEGVKYDHLGVVLVNAIKEQQAQIATQQTQLKQQAAQIQDHQREIEDLKSLMCIHYPKAESCKTSSHTISMPNRIRRAK